MEKLTKFKKEKYISNNNAKIINLTKDEENKNLLNNSMKN